MLGAPSFSDGERALSRFNEFLSGRFKWCVSGIEWPEAGHVERISADYDFARHIEGLFTRHQAMFSDRLCVFFSDGHNADIVAEADRADLLKVIEFVENWDDVLVTDFWVFDPKTGTCVEACHEGYLTLSAPFLTPSSG
ncbi:MAG: hypothetical protein U1E03_08575 [Hyphomonadaceae bacterium]